MKTNISIAVAMIVFAALMLASDALADSTTLNAVANQATVSSGASLSVNVNTSNVADLYDYQLDLTFNPNVVSAIGVTEGAFLQSGGSTFFIPGTIDNSAGSITFNRSI
jgi:Cohesin domain